MLPRARVTEVMADVERDTGFATCFTHLPTGSLATDTPAPLATPRCRQTAPTLAFRAWPTFRFGDFRTLGTSIPGVAAVAAAGECYAIPVQRQSGRSLCSHGGVGNYLRNHLARRCQLAQREGAVRVTQVILECRHLADMSKKIPSRQATS